MISGTINRRMHSSSARDEELTALLTEDIGIYDLTSIHRLIDITSVSQLGVHSAVTEDTTIYSRLV
jgi:hypothetical protein